MGALRATPRRHQMDAQPRGASTLMGALRTTQRPLQSKRGGTGGNVESSKRPPAKRFGAGAHAVAAAAAAAGMCRRDAGAAT
jgi:hypothetical protein